MSDDPIQKILDIFDFDQVDLMFEDVKAFHKKFGLIVSDVPVRLTDRKADERIEFMQEELDEYVAGVAEKDMAKIADSLVDLVYVALGTAVMHGLPWALLWNEVQRANMAKVRGTTHRGHAVDVMKPPGWVPPNHDPLLEASGWDRNALPIDDEGV